MRLYRLIQTHHDGMSGWVKFTGGPKEDWRKFYDWSVVVEYDVVDRISTSKTDFQIIIRFEERSNAWVAPGRKFTKISGPGMYRVGHPFNTFKWPWHWSKYEGQTLQKEQMVHRVKGFLLDREFLRKGAQYQSHMSWGHLRVLLVPPDLVGQSHLAIGGLRADSLQHSQSIAQAWARQQFGKALSLAEEAAASEDSDKAREAASVTKVLSSFGAKELSDAQALVSLEPNRSIRRLNALKKLYSGHQIGKQADEQLRAWKKDAELKQSIASLKAYQKFRDIMAPLIAKADEGEAPAAETLSGIKTAIEQIAERFPNSAGLHRAKRLRALLDRVQEKKKLKAP